MYQALFFANLSVAPSPWMSLDAPVINFRLSDLINCHTFKQSLLPVGMSHKKKMMELVRF